MRKFAWITFLTGLLLSGIAAFFSVVGLSMIFAGSFWAVAVLASALEVTKLVAVTWLYRYRQLASRPVRSYFYVATVVLMIITSLGIFGYLSRAHVDIEAGATQAQLTLDEINQREGAITAQRDQLSLELKSVSGQSDKLVDQLALSNRLTRANGAVEVQRENAKRRDAILKQLQETNAALTTIKKERIDTQANVSKATADIGPLRYVASAIYGNENQDTIRKAVIALTVLLMVVFDPMAVMLLIAANILFIKLAEEDETKRTKERTGRPAESPEVVPAAEVPSPKEADKIADKIDVPTITPSEIAPLDLASPAPSQEDLAPAPVPRGGAEITRKLRTKSIPAEDPNDPRTRASDLPVGLQPESAESVIKKVRRGGWPKNSYLKNAAKSIVAE